MSAVRTHSATRRRLAACLVLAVAALAALLGCSIKKMAVRKVGDSLSSGTSVFQTDDDIELVGEALPFSLKLVESLLQESPSHRGLRLTACRGFVTYSYGYVHYEADVTAGDDVDRARALRTRAKRLYLRAFDHGVRAIELDHPGFRDALARDPSAAVAVLDAGRHGENVPLLYWNAAALGLAISVAKNDAEMLARLPEVEALIHRAIQLDSSWDNGTLHEFEVVLAGAKPGNPDEASILEHYDAAVGLSGGKRPALFVARAEALSIPRQDRAGFEQLLGQALAIDPDAEVQNRLVNHFAQRRATWLLSRIDELFLEEGAP